LAVAEGKGVGVNVVLYMKDKPDRAQLSALIAALEDPVEDLVRKDSKFQALGLDPAAFVSNPAAVLDVLERHPALLQRPVLLKAGRAIIGRPKDRVAAFLG
jgi:arsenate reductase